MTLIIEIWGKLYWFILGFGIGIVTILELIKRVVDIETWNKINESDAIPNELKRIFTVSKNCGNCGMEEQLDELYPCVLCRDEDLWESKNINPKSIINKEVR